MNFFYEDFLQIVNLTSNVCEIRHECVFRPKFQANEQFLGHTFFANLFL